MVKCATATEISPDSEGLGLLQKQPTPSEPQNDGTE